MFKETVQIHSRTYTVHPYASAFAKLSDDDLSPLVEDIRRNGLRQPITVSGDFLVDGRNRLQACQYLGIEPTLVEVNDENLEELIDSLNTHKRHLSASQRAAAAVQTTAFRTNKNIMDCCEPIKLKFAIHRAEAISLGKRYNVSPRMIFAANKLYKEDQELFQLVIQGMNLNKALKLLNEKATTQEVKSEVKKISVGSKEQLEQLFSDSKYLWIDMTDKEQSHLHEIAISSLGSLTDEGVFVVILPPERIVAEILAKKIISMNLNIAHQFYFSNSKPNGAGHVLVGTKSLLKSELKINCNDLKNGFFVVTKKRNPRMLAGAILNMTSRNGGTFSILFNQSELICEVAAQNGYKCQTLNLDTLC